MTDNTTTGNDTRDDSGHVETGTLEHIDPNTLIVDTNVRDDAALDAEFIASIKEHGVLVPVVAVRGEDGQVLVRYGQRRTLAAREAGLSVVPVYVRTPNAGDEKAQLVERVAEQIVENDQRRELTNVQRAKGIQQMLDAGVSVTKVAKALSVKKDIVKAAGTAGGSQTAMEALATDQLSLTEAAALAEFDDMPGALSTGWCAMPGRSGSITPSLSSASSKPARKHCVRPKSPGRKKGSPFSTAFPVRGMSNTSS